MNKYQEILAQLEEYFCSLLIIQYKNSPQNRAMIKELVNLIFANNLALQIKELCVDVNNSIGAQLDVVGKWVGLDRYYTGFELWNKKYFSLPSYSHIRNNNYNPYMGGFSNYENFNTLTGAFLTYRQYQDVKTAKNAMGDEFFRQLIKLKIIKNSIIQTNKSIDEAIYNWSGGQVYTTWENPMQITYNYNSSFKNIIDLAVYKNILLAPCGVEIVLNEVA